MRLSLERKVLGSNLRTVKSRGGVLKDILGPRTHFQVLGFGFRLEAYKSLKMSYPRFEDSILFWLVKKKKKQTKDNISDSLSIRCSFFLHEK